MLSRQLDGFGEVFLGIRSAGPQIPPQPVQAGTLDEDQKAQLQHFKEMLALADPERIAEALMPLTAFLPSALMEKLQQAIDFYDYDEALALLPPDTL